jgi:hypothetical protein
MRSFFCGQFSLSQVIVPDWRVRAVVLAALISSQGCGIISDTRSRALSTRGLPPSESQPGNRPSDKPVPPGRGSETPPETNLPSPPETKQPLWVTRILDRRRRR